MSAKLENSAVASSTQFSRLVVSDSSWLHEPQDARPPCPSPTPGVYSNSSALSRWCHPTISSSVVPFSSFPQSFPAHQGLFQWVFASAGQSTGVSASTSVLPMNTQDWSPLGWSGWISLQSKGLSNLLYYSSKASILWCSAFFIVQLSHPHMTTGKTTSLTRWTFVGKVMFLLFNMLSRLVMTFLSRSKHLNFMTAITICSDFGAQKNKDSHCFHCSPSICHEVMGPDTMIFVFWMLSFKPTFSLSSFIFTFIKRLFSSSSLSAIRVLSSAYLRLLVFLLAVLIPAMAKGLKKVSFHFNSKGNAKESSNY